MPASINLTDRAAKHVKDFIEKNESGIGLRIAVKTTGCSGHQYVIESAERVNDQDQTFESRGVTLVVDNQSMKYLAGTELDYVREGLNEGFKFNNPNVAETCGCGESFNIKSEEETA